MFKLIVQVNESINFLNEEEGDLYMDIEGFPEINKMFGYADIVQNEMELECEMVTHGLFCGDGEAYKSVRMPEFKKNAKDWLLLLQIDSNEDDAGMIWGDVGRIYFWIKKEDLMNKNFDKTWVIIQCF